MVFQRCLFCGGDASEPNHLEHCDGRQGFQELLVGETIDPSDVWKAYEHVRTSDPDTSHAAAYSLDEDDISRNMARVQDILRLRPMTHPEIYTEYVRRHGPCGQSSPRSRCKDLVRAGLVEDSGERRLLPSGRKSIVWRLVVKPAQEVTLEAATV